MEAPDRILLLGANYVIILVALTSSVLLKTNISEEEKLANTQSAKKRMRQTKKLATNNRVHRSSARTYIKRARTLIDEGRLDEAETVARQAYKALDKAGRKHVIHPRNAARRKGRLMAALDAARKEQTAS